MHAHITFDSARSIVIGNTVTRSNTPPNNPMFGDKWLPVATGEKWVWIGKWEDAEKDINGFIPDDPPIEPPVKRDMFVEALEAMGAAANSAAAKLADVATQADALREVMAFQSAVMRDCQLTIEEDASRLDALWECQALAIRLEPRTFEKTYTMYGTQMLEVAHGMFTRDVLVQVFDDYTGYEFPPSDFLIFDNGANTVTLQFVGPDFRKPPYVFTTQGARKSNNHHASRLRVRVTA
jgi:hypothetical protein